MGKGEAAMAAEAALAHFPLLQARASAGDTAGRRSRSVPTGRAKARQSHRKGESPPKAAVCMRSAACVDVQGVMPYFAEYKKGPEFCRVVDICMCGPFRP